MQEFFAFFIIENCIFAVLPIRIPQRAKTFCALSLDKRAKIEYNLY